MKLNLLRSKVEALVEAHLKHCAPVGWLEGRRKWAAAICGNIASDPISLQPGNMLDAAGVKEYKKMLKRSGRDGPAHAVIFRLINNNYAEAEQLLDFPLDDGTPIADLACELFGEIPSAFMWLRMVEFEDHADGWKYLIAEAAAEC